MNDIQQKNLKINYKTLNDGISCMTVFNQFGMLINQLNNEEADYIYNLLVGNSDKCMQRLKEENKKLYIDTLKSHINYNPIIKIQETADLVIVKTEIGEIKYSKLKLAIFWLTHSNDDFFNAFKFSWVPDSKLQNIARNKINQGITVGPNFGKKSHQVEEIKIVPPKVFALDKITSDELFGSIAETTQNLIKKNLEGFKQ